jgi:formate-dependent nitrite reductase membrane component NrfD
VVLAGFVSLVFVGATTGLLVYDLEQPLRFLSILRRPQWKSWLTRGAVILVGFSTVTGLWWLLEAGALLGVLPNGWADGARPVALWVGLPLAVGVAIYTAFLFAQAEGRDLWQSSLLPVHLLVQAVMTGGAAFLILDLVAPISSSMAEVAVIAFGVSLGLDLFLLLAGELGIPHASELAAQAAHDITHGRYRRQFWWGTVAVGHIVPLILVALGGPLLSLAGALAIVGLYLYEHAFVMAPQRLPNS